MQLALTQRGRSSVDLMAAVGAAMAAARKTVAVELAQN